MTNFAARGGYARWVTSPILSQDDWEALWMGESAKTDEILKDVLSRNVKEDKGQVVSILDAQNPLQTKAYLTVSSVKSLSSVP